MRRSWMLVLVAATLLAPGSASAGWPNLREWLRRPVPEARARASLIRACIATHRELQKEHPALPLPSSEILPGQVAAAKTYGASWTCRESSRLLIRRLVERDQRLTLDSSGKNAFRWGAEGLVSFHYYAVDDPGAPRLLVDATAVSNFGLDVGQGGVLRRLLGEAGSAQRKPAAAARVLKRIERGGIDGLLVLAHPDEIAVYRDALERAANLRRGMTRDAERR